MTSIAGIHNLYAFEDGDTLTPGMGVSIDKGYGLQQYWNPSLNDGEGGVVSTDFTKHPGTIYPQAYSSKAGDYIVPESQGQQWYYNNIGDNAGIIGSDGKVKPEYATLFAIGTIESNGKTFPCLKIIGNLANKNDYTDKYIYYKSTWRGRTFVCSQLIPIQAAIGDIYDILLNAEGADGTGDNVLSNDNDWIDWTANLQRAGESVKSGVEYTWQHLVNKVWEDLRSGDPGITINGNTIRIENSAVEGMEIFRSKAHYNNNDYLKVFNVTDIHDPYYIDDGCSVAGDSVREGEKVTFNPVVYDRSTGKPDTDTWTITYTLIAGDGSVIEDLDQTQINYDNILKYKGIKVRIEAKK
ncbi:MAG: hypothetical protein LKE54_03740 [Prevotella sp.]|jgi:hypothetical protein|nr:hypothetical protein [Prevotella sp.]MCH3994159.1 hypothetical protein [Prevotella sp.]